MCLHIVAGVAPGQRLPGPLGAIGRMEVAQVDLLVVRVVNRSKGWCWAGVSF